MKLYSYSKAISTILFLPLLVGCTPSQLEVKVIDEYTNEYTHFDLYKIEFPSDWSIDQDQDSSISFYSPIEGESDKYIDSVNISIYENTESWTIEEDTVEEYTVELNKDSGDYSILESVLTTVGGNDARKVIYSTPNGELDMILFQVWTVKDNLFYLITLFSEEYNHENYINVTQGMIDSFEFL